MPSQGDDLSCCNLSPVFIFLCKLSTGVLILCLRPSSVLLHHWEVSPSFLVLMLWLRTHWPRPNTWAGGQLGSQLSAPLSWTSKAPAVLFLPVLVPLCLSGALEYPGNLIKMQVLTQHLWNGVWKALIFTNSLVLLMLLEGFHNLKTIRRGSSKAAGISSLCTACGPIRNVVPWAPSRPAESDLGEGEGPRDLGLTSLPSSHKHDNTGLEEYVTCTY